MDDDGLKILFLGPAKAGKSTIVNFLSSHNENPSENPEYMPTKSLRILEMEHGQTSVELWDTCGKYQDCISAWPAICRGSHAVVLVCDASQASSQERELAETWLNLVQQHCGKSLSESQFMIMVHDTSGAGVGKKVKFGKALSKFEVVYSSIDGKPDELRNEFERFLNKLIQKLSSK